MKIRLAAAAVLAALGMAMFHVGSASAEPEKGVSTASSGVTSGSEDATTQHFPYD
jgi:hypothetical protein